MGIAAVGQRARPGYVRRAVGTDDHQADRAEDQAAGVRRRFCPVDHKVRLHGREGDKEHGGS